MSKQTPDEMTKKGDTEAFEDAARTTRQSSIRDGWAYLRDARKVWLTPLIVLLLVLGLLISLSGSVLSPFIYTLF